MEEKSDFESKIFDASMTFSQKKDNARIRMHELSKSLEDVDPRLLMRLKDYLHYHGQGWSGGTNPLVIEKGKFPDRVSKAFIKILTIVEDCVKTDNMMFLNDYLKAMEEHGITITIDKDRFVHIENSNISDVVHNMNSEQCVICESTDCITELGKRAAANNIVPKKNFKSVVSLMYAKRVKKKDKQKKIQKEIGDSELYKSNLVKI